MQPLGSWNLPALLDPSGQPFIPDDMRVIVWQDGAPLDINGLPKRLAANVIWDASNAGRSRLDLYDAGTPGMAFNALISALKNGACLRLPFRCDMPTGTMESVPPPQHPCVDPCPFPNMEPTSDSFSYPRPDSGFDAPLGELEPGDDFGNTYRDFPDDFRAQEGMNPKKATRRLIRADAFAFKMRQPASAFDPACDIAFLQSIGQNTNENGTVLYTALLPLYSRAAQVGILKDYRRNNTQINLAVQNGDLVGFRACAALSRANGLFVNLVSLDAGEIQNLAADKSIDTVTIGYEADLKVGNSGGQLDALIAAACAVCVPLDIDVWIHLSSTGGPDHKQNWACPQPGVEYNDWWVMNHRMGVTGLKGETWMNSGPPGLQPGQDPFAGEGSAWSGDSAGKMGAMFGYSRRGIQTASVETPDRPPLLFCVSETWSEPRFYGYTSAAFALRRSRELMACPEPGCPPLAGCESGTQDWNADLQPW